MERRSMRLCAVAALVPEGARLADIGTDHAYIPVDLVKEGVCPSAIAMDINAGPLQIAASHITDAGLDTKIQTRLSDGMEKLSPGEADCAVIAGMGGALTIHILEGNRETAQALSRLVLQPQSELLKVREYLAAEGYEILTEDMVLEDGKYYPMMLVHYTGKAYSLTEEEKTFGPLLMRQKHPVLKAFLEREIRIHQGILKQLENSQEPEKILARRNEVMTYLAMTEQVLHTFA